MASYVRIRHGATNFAIVSKARHRVPQMMLQEFDDAVVHTTVSTIV